VAFPADTLAQEIETFAVRLAEGAGEILSAHFGRQISIEYKDKAHRDPVTAADTTCQEFLVAEIAQRFPDHGILGEEDAGASDTACPDYLWVLDPLDGTTNFINGLPVYASSIGVLYRGRPLAGAPYIPWPKPGGGLVMHCRRGGGCFADGEPVTVYQSKEPVNNRLVGLPGSFAHTSKFAGRLTGSGHSNGGEPRTTGSSAYELAMTASGVLQYSIQGSPHLWDVAAGVLAVTEAQGTVMARLPGEKRWNPLECLVPSWETRSPSMKELRRWVAPLVAGNRQVAPLIAHSIRPRFRLSAKLRRLTRPFRGKKRPAGKTVS
jgi:myo-inositol-1(or 4)-monophosphatase